MLVHAIGNLWKDMQETLNGVFPLGGSRKSRWTFTFHFITCVYIAMITYKFLNKTDARKKKTTEKIERKYNQISTMVI